MEKEEDITVYFTGEKLYGDDFSLEEIEKWFEREGSLQKLRPVALAYVLNSIQKGGRTMLLIITYAYGG